MTQVFSEIQKDTPCDFRYQILLFRLCRNGF